MVELIQFEVSLNELPNNDKEKNMLFDVNQTEFQSEIHRAIWAIGKSIVPFEISIAEIIDIDLINGLRQVYDFSIDILSEMYENPGKYGLIDGKNCLDRTGSVTSFYRFLNNLIHSQKVQLNNNDWIVITEQINDINKLNLLIPMGIVYVNDNGVTTIKSIKYPLFLKYFYMCYEASIRRKVNCFWYIVSCDFRIFNKKFGLKLNDILMVLSDKDKSLVLELHNHLLSKGIKPKSRKYYYRVTYEYNNQFVMNTEILGSTYLFFQVSLGKNQWDKDYNFIVNEIENSPNKDELIKYVVKNITCCNLCFGSKSKKDRCERWGDIFGNRRLLCFEFCLSNKKKSERNIIYHDYDIKMLKQFLDLRIKSIENSATS
jgi:hypothetical protein